MQSAATNGITPPKMVYVSMAGSSVLSTNRFVPIGGLISPISTTTTMRMPKKVGSAPSVGLRSLRWTQQHDVRAYFSAATLSSSERNSAKALAPSTPLAVTALIQS